MDSPGPEQENLAPHESALPGSHVLQILFERAPEIITLTGPDGRQSTVNAAGLRHLGFPETFRRPEEGMLFVHPDDRARLQAHRDLMDEMAAKGEPIDRLPAIRFRVRSASGEWRWLESVFSDMTDIPEVGGRVAFSRDVTEVEHRAQALRESEARLAGMVASLRAGAFVEDQDGVVILANQRLLELFGVDLPAHAIVGRPSREVHELLGSAPPEPRPVRRRPSPDGVSDFALTLPDGRLVDGEHVVIHAGSEPFGQLWLFYDATARRVEERRRETLLELERQARDLAEREAKRLREYDQLRDDFVARVSHDLRTPLTAILAASELLLDRGSGIADDARTRLAMIHRNAQRLHAMIEDLLLAGRLNAGMLDLEVEPTRIEPLLRDLADLYAETARSRDVALVVEAPGDAVVIADRRRLTIAIENLIDNAIKFTSPGTEVAITLRRESSDWVIAVRDHGPGIAPELRDSIFQRFIRSPEADRSETPGSGVGLNIVKGLVELHGGRVSVAEADGGGAVFECSIPAADESERA